MDKRDRGTVGANNRAPLRPNPKKKREYVDGGGGGGGGGRAHRARVRVTKNRPLFAFEQYASPLVKGGEGGEFD